MASDRVIGTVAVYKRGGYAWLDYEGQHVFCHIQDVKGRTVLHEGETIQFRLVETPRGLRALKAVVVSDQTT
jgi:cold shock CspA family protein